MKSKIEVNKRVEENTGNMRTHQSPEPGACVSLFIIVGYQESYYNSTIVLN
jgi:hypothetical protein